MKHYSLRSAGGSQRPSLLFEIKIDLHDVRSGYNVSETAWYAGQWIAGRLDESWTEDMVSRVDYRALKAIAAPEAVDWPEWGDDEIVRYLTRYYRPQIWKNRDLRLYSRADETRQEFVERCREELVPERLRDMKKLREVFLHRFFEMEHRLISSSRDEDLDEDVQLRRATAATELFSDVREDLSRIFVEDEFRLLGEADLNWDLADPDADDRLQDLRADLVDRYNEINSRLEEEACGIESYDVTASRTAFEIVTRSILWQ